MKQLLIINGSPRPQGLIANMLSVMRQEAEGRGWSVRSICAHQLLVRPCTGCMVCRNTGQCCLPPDNAQEVLQLIRQADALIVGTPCYWGNMPGHLKVLFDRMVYGLMGESPRGLPQPLHKGKRAIVVATCTTVFPFNIIFGQSRGAVRALREILKWSGFKMAGTLEKGGTRQHPSLSKREESRLRKLVRRL